MSIEERYWDNGAEAWDRDSLPSRSDSYLKTIIHRVWHKTDPRPVGHALAALAELDRRAKSGEYGPTLLAQFAELRRAVESKIATA